MTYLNSGFYCKFCKGRHASAETLRKCYEENYEEHGVKESFELPSAIGANMIGENMSVPDLERWSMTSSVLPTGNYLVSVILQNGYPKAIHLRIGSMPGKWAGSYVISTWDEKAGKLVPVYSVNDRGIIIDKLLVKNWQRAMCDYGRTFSQCPICEGSLSSDELKMGVHEKSECIKKIYP